MKNQSNTLRSQEDKRQAQARRLPASPKVPTLAANNFSKSHASSVINCAPLVNNHTFIEGSRVP